MKAGINYHEEVPIADKSIDLYFGVVLAGFFFALSLIPLLKGDGIRLWPIYVGVVLLFFSFLLPGALTHLRKLWIRFGLLTQKITQPLILAIVFYGLFTPLGVLMRFFGKDPLFLKKTSGVATYWTLRDLQQIDANMKNQF